MNFGLPRNRQLGTHKATLIRARSAEQNAQYIEASRLYRELGDERAVMRCRKAQASLQREAFECETEIEPNTL